MAIVLTSESHLTQTENKLSRETRFLDVLKYVEIISGLIIIAYFCLVKSAAAGQGFFWGGVLVFLGISHYMKARENIDSSKLFEYGRKGEEKVASILKEQLPDNFWLLNDMIISLGGIIKKKQAQIDHIAVGPGGIFVIETKAYTGRLIARKNQRELTQIKYLDNGKKEIKKLTNPVVQNEYHIDVLKKFMNKKGLSVPLVYSLIIFTSPKASYDLECEGHYIFKNISAAVTFMVSKSAGPAYEPQKARAFFEALGVDSKISV
jgi:hypothetical protein